MGRLACDWLPAKSLRGEPARRAGAAAVTRCAASGTGPVTGPGRLRWEQRGKGAAGPYRNPG